MLDWFDILVGIGSGISWAIVPSLGELKMSGLAKEKTDALQPTGYSSTSTSYYTPISLLDLAETFQNFPGTNTNGVSYPNSTKQHAMSEWRGYDHDYGLSCSTLTTRTLGYATTLLGDPCSQNQTTYYTNNSNWLSSTQLYRDQGGGSCIPAKSGFYYENGTGSNTPIRYWDGNAFTGNYGCP